MLEKVGSSVLYPHFLENVDIRSLVCGNTPKQRLSEIHSYTYALEGESKCWQGDLTAVRARVIEDHPELGIDEIYIGELDYRRFWKKCKDNPGVPLDVPSKVADYFWHTHIFLSTKKYRKDSVEYFGYYLEHEAKEDGKCGGSCKKDGDDGGGIKQ